jgi:ribonuclease G
LEFTKLKREILINGGQRETRVAILEDDRLVEILYDRQDKSRSVGDIYLGRVEAILPGIQASFVDVGKEKSAFLHASDLLEPDDDDEGNDGDQNGGEKDQTQSKAGGRGRGRGGGGGGSGGRRMREGRRKSIPNVADVLSKGEQVLVQVTKEPISTKGSRVTRQISIPGRFLVFMPYASRVGVSRKIENREQRATLRKMVQNVLPKGVGGVIVRTVAEGITEQHFKREIDSLLKIWKKIERKKQYVRAPALVQREASMTRSIIRDLLSDKVDSLNVDSKDLYNEIEEYLKQVDPDMMERVHMYRESTPIFDRYDIEAEIRGLFRSRVELPTGGSIIIQPTEALVSIDVNTGRYTGKKDPEKTILRTNLEAAREIARQLRLRDTGGIVVIDFIDMETKSHREKVLNELRGLLVRDRARTRAYAVSELGLIQMTRQRVRPSLLSSQTAECPSCAGTGRVFTPEIVTRRLERTLKRAGQTDRDKRLAIRLHPEVALYLLEQEPRLMKALIKGTGLELELRDDPMMRLDEFRLMSRPAERDVTELYAVA